MTETEAAFHLLELDAAWMASEQMRTENASLQKYAEAERECRLKYAARSDGYARISSVVQKMRAYSMTREEALEQIITLVNATNDRLGRIHG